MKLNRIASITIIVLVLVFVVCQIEINTEQLGNLVETFPHDVYEKNTQEVEHTVQENNMSNETGFPISVELTKGDSMIKKGKLDCLITDIKVISNISEIENTNGFVNDAEVTVSNYGTLRYPDFITDNGMFVNGVYLLVVDVYVSNIDAVCYTTQEKLENGSTLGIYDNPYLFRADFLFYLQDVHDGEDGIVYEDSSGLQHIYIPSWGIDYYSNLGDGPGDPVSYELKPGESISFSVGFLVSDISMGGAMHFDALYLTEVVGSVEDFIIQVNVDKENKE